MVSSHSKKVSQTCLKGAADRPEEPSSRPMGKDAPEELSLKRQAAAEGLSCAVVTAFQKQVYRFYAEQGRKLPWRETGDPYRVLVSEVMLQQTQVERVIPKFNVFLTCFPTAAALAEAPLAELLSAWQGLGYNRRALNLQRAARMIAEQWNGVVPDDPILLQRLPGIGPYTAGAISTFASNRPNVFLETNIRAVLLHFFFADQNGISDKQLLPVADAVLDRENPRDWYNALMDYGSDLKRRFPNPSRRSRHHAVQSRFEGSDRQIRGAILRLLLASSGMTTLALHTQLDVEADRFKWILEGMLKDGFLKQRGRKFLIP